MEPRILPASIATMNRIPIVGYNPKSLPNMESIHLVKSILPLHHQKNGSGSGQYPLEPRLKGRLQNMALRHLFGEILCSTLLGSGLRVSPRRAPDLRGRVMFEHHHKQGRTWFPRC